MACVKISDTRPRGIRQPWRELFRLGCRAFEELFLSPGRHLATDRRAGSAAVAACLDELDRRMLGGIGVPGRKASPAICSFPSSRIRFLASRSSQSSAFRSGSAASSRRRSWTHLPTVYGLRPSSEQHCVIGLPVEITLSAASRLSSSAYLANGFDMVPSLRSSSA